jgi:hypothetical protein
MARLYLDRDEERAKVRATFRPSFPIHGTFSWRNLEEVFKEARKHGSN